MLQRCGIRLAACAECRWAETRPQIAELAADRGSSTPLPRRSQIFSLLSCGGTNTALSAIKAQRRAPAGLASEGNEAAATQAALKAERASLAAQGRRIEK